MAKKITKPVPAISANTQLFHRAVRHAVMIERLKNTEVRAVMNLLNTQVLPDLLSQIDIRLSQAAMGMRKLNYADARLSAMRQTIRSIMDTGMRSVSDMMRGRLLALADVEAKFQVAAMRGAITVPFDFIAPSPATLRAVVSAKPFNGAILSDWFDSISRVSQDRISRAINVGIVEGESVPDLVRRIRGTAASAFGDGAAGAIRRDVEAVVRTSVNYVSTEAREQTYAANEGVIDGVQIVATLDTRTCPTCMDQDGKVYDIDNGWRPPGHYNCRCTTVPVLKSWKKLGIKASEADASTRASMDGQVPSTMTYGQWLKTQPEDVQNEALGPTRAGLFRAGKVSIDGFVDDRGRQLTLEQIKRREGI